MVIKVSKIGFTAIFFFVSPLFAEEPFCGNKCHDIGVATIRNCYCDRACSYIFNDCCGDSEYLFTHYAHEQYSRQRMSCEALLNENLHTLVVNTCPSDWKGPESIRNSCTLSTERTLDPFAGVPVTNPNSEITYSSFYCAICNSDAQTMIFWKIGVDCPSIKNNLEFDNEEAMNYIFYNESSQQWGFLLRDHVTKDVSFHGCKVMYKVPDDMASKVRDCQPDEVDTCSPSWKMDNIRHMCRVYTDPVYANHTRYKNFYCAMCNRVDQSELFCGPAVGPRYPGLPEADFGSANFALLLDFNQAGGNKVGKKATVIDCSMGEVYDPFKKKCLNIVCGLPGYKVKDGKCEQENR